MPIDRDVLALAVLDLVQAKKAGLITARMYEQSIAAAHNLDELPEEEERPWAFVDERKERVSPRNARADQ